MARPCDKDGAIAWLRRKLGCGVTAVELTEEQAEDSFDDAIRWWVGRKGLKKHAVQNLTPGVQEYTMPDDCDMVLEVFFPGVQLDIIAAVNPYAFIDVDQLPVAYSSITGVPGGSFYGTFVQILQHAETARRVVGSEPTWEYRKNENVLWIFPRNQRNGAAIARYASNDLSSETCDDEFGSKITVRDRDIILKWALADAKETLGRIRSKYGEWPTAGGQRNLDGDTLRTEGLAEKEKLDEEVIGLSDPVPFLTG